MKINNIKYKESNEVIGCFEKEYGKDGITYMDVYIAGDIQILLMNVILCFRFKIKYKFETL